MSHFRSNFQPKFRSNGNRPKVKVRHQASRPGPDLLLVRGPTFAPLVKPNDFPCCSRLHGLHALNCPICTHKPQQPFFSSSVTNEQVGLSLSLPDLQDALALSHYTAPRPGTPYNRNIFQKPSSGFLVKGFLT